MNSRHTPLLLLILDGWGMASPGTGNAISRAHTPNLDRILSGKEVGELLAGEEAVGLPPGQMGNSEVGHMNLGAGRVVYQDIMRINMSIDQGTMAQNEALTQALDRCSGRVHFMGLLSDGGVHSHQRHLQALLDIAWARNLTSYVHCFMDGRDTSPHSGKNFLAELQDFLQGGEKGKIASLSGRYYAMDRDERWDRTRTAYEALVLGEGEAILDPVQGMEGYYRQGVTDEFVPPSVVRDGQGEPVACIQPGDTVVFFNFRADRARQITQALCQENFAEFPRKSWPNPDMVTMTSYDAQFPLPVIFPPLHLENILGQVVSEHGLTQLRLAETEKYAHVTYFFNGGEETPFPGEDRILIPSPREVSTYDQKPEMSVYSVSETLCSKLLEQSHSLYVCNFANLDMVGHTGDMQAVIRACEAVDECVGNVLRALDQSKGTAFITADHGNADDMLDAEGNPKTSHSLNPVPAVLYPPGRKGLRRSEGILGDVAPTLLSILDMEQPVEMSGKSLV